MELRMKLNKKQTTNLLIWLFVILVAFIAWFSFGGEVFTKTQILVEKQDELLGTSYQEWKDQFVLGLDYTLGFVFLTTISTGFIMYITRDKKNKQCAKQIK